MKKLLMVFLFLLTCVCLTLSACKKKAEEAAPATAPTGQVAPASEAAAPATPPTRQVAPAPEAAAPATFPTGQVAPAPETAAPAPAKPIGNSLPPIRFNGPPDVVAMPDTDDVYVAPDMDVDMFFWNGWWWRPYEGRWYRSQYYDRGWADYNNVPSFYSDVDPSWRRYYRDRNWYGHRWDYDRIPHQRLQQNWNSWHNNRYWERERNWDVQGYNPRPQDQREELRHQRQEQYQQRPEIQRDQQQRQEQKRQPQVQQPLRQQEHQ